jgi:hypothetical protein
LHPHPSPNILFLTEIQTNDLYKKIGTKIGLKKERNRLNKLSFM